MSTLLHEINYAVRKLQNAPAFAALAVLTLAMGIGANTAMFTVIEFRAPLRCSRAFGKEEEIVSHFSRHLFLSAQARLGNVPGYCHSSLAGLDYWRHLFDSIRPPGTNSLFSTTHTRMVCGFSRR